MTLKIGMSKIQDYVLPARNVILTSIELKDMRGINMIELKSPSNLRKMNKKKLITEIERLNKKLSRISDVIYDKDVEKRELIVLITHLKWYLDLDCI